MFSWSVLLVMVSNTSLFEYKPNLHPFPYIISLSARDPVALCVNPLSFPFLWLHWELLTVIVVGTSVCHCTWNSWLWLHLVLLFVIALCVPVCDCTRYFRIWLHLVHLFSSLCSLLSVTAPSTRGCDWTGYFRKWLWFRNFLSPMFLNNKVELY